MLRLIKFWFTLVLIAGTLIAVLLVTEVQRQERDIREGLSSEALGAFLTWANADLRATELRAASATQLAESQRALSLVAHSSAELSERQRRRVAQEDSAESALLGLSQSLPPLSTGERIIAVVDSTGQLVAATSDQTVETDALIEVRRALVRGSASDGVQIVDGELFVTAAAPIVFENELIVGAIWLAEPALAINTNEDWTFDVLFYRDGEVVISTLDEGAEARLGSLPVANPETLGLGRAGAANMIERGSTVFAAIPTVFREPSPSDDSPPTLSPADGAGLTQTADSGTLVAMVVVEARTVPTTWESVGARLQSVDLMDQRLLGVGGAALLVFLLTMGVISLDARLLRKRVSRGAREDEAERIRSRSFEPSSGGPVRSPEVATPAISSLRDSASVKRATGEITRLTEQSGLEVASSDVVDQPLPMPPTDDFPSLPLVPPTPDDLAGLVFPPEDSAAAIDSGLADDPSFARGLANPFDSDFPDDSEALPLLPPQVEDPMFRLTETAQAAKQARADADPPDWLLSTQNAEQKTKQGPKSTVPIASSARDKLLSELLGDQSVLSDSQSGPRPLAVTVQGGPEVADTVRSEPIPDNLLAQSDGNNLRDELQSDFTAAGSTSHYQRLYEQFVAARKQCGLATGNLEFNSFRAKVERKEKDFMERHDCDAVELEVFVREGKVGLKAKPAG